MNIRASAILGNTEKNSDIAQFSYDIKYNCAVLFFESFALSICQAVNTTDEKAQNFLVT